MIRCSNLVKNWLKKLLKMEETVLAPPKSVRGMLELDKNAFTIEVELPTIYVPANRAVSEVVNRLKMHGLLLRYKVKSARKRRIDDDENNGNESLVPIMLNPEKFKNFTSLPIDIQNFLEKFHVSESSNFRMVNSSIGYYDWSKEDIFKAVLPEGDHTVSGFSQVGHIVHINLKESLYPYKKFIGQVLVDKVPQAKTVINKMKTIESTYRNFQIELLAGEPNYKTRVKENGCLFDLDFSKVYWNSRLCTEHKRVADLVQKNDLVIDATAGIGPFVVLAAKMFAPGVKIPGGKQLGVVKTKDFNSGTSETLTVENAPIRVLANDLNPESTYWLEHNFKLNKIPEAMYKCFNLDAAEFIESHCKMELINFINNGDMKNRKIHILMNLPASAVTFLPSFLGLLSGCGNEIDPKRLDHDSSPLPIFIYCYTFSKHEVSFYLNLSMPNIYFILIQGPRC